MNTTTANVIAAHALDLLRQKRAILYPQGEIFRVRLLDDRCVLVFDTAAVVQSRIDETFTHELSARLHGRRVVCTSERGLFLQIGYTIPAHVDLTATPLDLTQQPTPWSLPIGATERGPLWVSLIEGDSFLIGGTRGFGKSTILHGWIQSLVNGGKTIVRVWDGKEGVEFSRYSGNPNILVMDDLRKGLISLQQTINERHNLLLKSGKPNMVLYNQACPEDEQVLPIALIIDEATLVPEDTRELLIRIVERERAVGIYPVLATNRPSAAGVFCKGNLGTRLCLAVPSHYDSQMVLVRSGAEKLPKQKGRGLIEHGARLVEFQAFTIDIPDAVDSYQGEKLSPVELMIVRNAIEGGGRLTIPLVQEWLGDDTDWKARQTLRTWEGRGWIAKDPYQNNERSVTPVLRGVFEQITQTTQTTQTAPIPTQTTQTTGEGTNA